MDRTPAGAFALALALALSGCAAAVPVVAPVVVPIAGQVAREAGGDLTREVARRAIASDLEARFPGVPLEPITDCVVVGATTREMLTIAAEGRLAAPRPRTARIVSEALGRPAVRQCLNARALAAVRR